MTDYRGEATTTEYYLQYVMSRSALGFGRWREEREQVVEVGGCFLFRPQIIRIFLRAKRPPCLSIVEAGVGRDGSAARTSKI